MPEEFVSCTLCNRVVEAEHVNSTGRCSECAGLRSDEADAEKEE